jgi:hypothetical protein
LREDFFEEALLLDDFFVAVDFLDDEDFLPAEDFLAEEDLVRVDVFFLLLDLVAMQISSGVRWQPISKRLYRAHRESCVVRRSSSRDRRYQLCRVPSSSRHTGRYAGL